MKKLLIILSLSTSSLFSLSIELTQSFISNSDKSTHFIYANRWGQYTESNFLSYSGLNVKYNTKINNFNITLEGDIGAGLNDEPYFNINELYAQVDFYFLNLYIGKKQSVLGDVDGELTSGSMTISNNASPIPKVSIGIFDYFTIPYTFNVLEIKGNISHGWFQGDRYVSDIFLHEKSLYFRLNSHIGLYPYGGLVHEAMWYGKPNDGKFKDQYLNDLSLQNYIIIFRARAGEEDAAFEGDQINKLGNHLGAWEYGLYGYYNLVDFQFYYQHLFEDGSGMEYQNEYDGLWGISIKPKFIKYIDSFLVEFLTTKFQSGDAHDKDGVILGGKDSYYHHGIYLNGWTHLNNVLGNSFFSTSGEDEDLRISNNRMEILHFGINGNITNTLNYTLKYAYANYYPAYASVIEYTSKTTVNHLYGEVKVNILEDTDISIGVALDIGENVKIGGILTFKRTL